MRSIEEDSIAEAAAKMNEEKLKVINGIISGNHDGLDMGALFHW